MRARQKNEGKIYRPKEKRDFVFYHIYYFSRQIRRNNRMATRAKEW